MAAPRRRPRKAGQDGIVRGGSGKGIPKAPKGTSAGTHAVVMGFGRKVPK